MRESGDAAAKIPRSSQWKEHLDECGSRPLLDLLLRNWLFSSYPRAERLPSKQRHHSLPALL